MVSNPSHSNARIVEFLPETDVSLLSQADTVICEGEEFDFLREQDQITICEDGYCSRKFIDDVIAEQFSKIITKIMFKI